MWSSVATRCFLSPLTVGNSTHRWLLSAEGHFLVPYMNFPFSILHIISETKSGVLSHMVTGQWREFLTPFIKSGPQWKLARGCWTPGGLGLSVWLMFWGWRRTNEFSIFVADHRAAAAAARWIWADPTEEKTSVSGGRLFVSVIF